MIPSRLRKFIPIAILALAAGIFFLDFLTPVGVADWVLYFIPLLLSFYARGRFSPYLLAAVFSVLTILGFFLSPPGMDIHLALVNLALGVGTLFAVACLLVQARKSSDETRKLSRAIEQTPVSVVITDLAGNISYVNPKFTEATGYAANEILGRNPRILKSGEMPSEAYKRLWETISAGKEWEGTFHNRKKNGELFWEKSRIVPIFNEAGATTHFLAVKEDITERKRVEDALRASEVRYRSLFENMLEGFAHCQMVYAHGQPEDFIFLAVNKAFEAISGLKEVVGKRVTEVVPGFKAAHPDLLATYGRVEATGQPERFELQLLISAAWVDISVYKPAEGQIALVFADITERRQAENAVRKSERRYRRFVERNAAGVLCSRMDGQIIECNESLARMLGYDSVDEIKTRSMTDLYFKPGDRQNLLKRLKDNPILADFENCFKRKDGKPIWVIEKIALVEPQDEEAHLIESTVIDITERKEAAVTLQESENRYRQLVETSPDAIFIGACGGRITFVNSAGLKLLGAASPEQILQRPLMDFVHPKFRERVMARVLKFQKDHQPAPRLREQFLRLDGSVVDVEVSAIPFTFEGQDAAQIVVHDVTETTRLESQVLRLQRMENLGMLAGGIAHDLNNVLAPLLFSIEVLKDKITDADGRKLLNSLEANVQRGAGLVKQVLTFGRGIGGDRVPLQPTRIVREIRHIVQETFPKSINFEYKSPAELWTVTGDATQLHQVLLNLVVNARDAMPDGGELSITLENVLIDETYIGMNPDARRGPHVLIKVVDTGIGIPAEIRDKIYDPFFTTKELGKGTGLGLSTTLGIVRSHGGFIHCYSEMGQGSTFKVYLPANPTEAAAENAAVGQTRLSRGHNELVLVVDDEAAIRQTVQKTLEHFGYRVLLAENGAVALSLYALHRQEIAVIITDMAMPIMDGPATMVGLLAMNPQVKIIGSSGLAANGAVAKAIEAGVKYFIPKPYTAETMLGVLSEVLP
jgi:PAS domain S-box-containing protein